MQRQHQCRAARQQRLGAPDLRHARQKDQNIALMRRQGILDCFRRRLRQFARGRDVARHMPHVHRMHAAIAGNHRRIEQRRQGSGIGGGRHRQDPQFRPQPALQIQHQRQRQIGFQAALMHLVENHAGHTRQARVGQQARGEQPFGDHLDFGGRRDGFLQPGAKADAAAHRFAQQCRHPGRGGPRRQPPRLQDQNLAAKPGLQQRQRHQCGFAGAGRRHQHGVRAATQGFLQRGEHIVDRQIGRQVKHLRGAYHLCGCRAI